MALPRVASTVHTFTTYAGKKLNFRAYKMGDEQALLEAKESKDPELIVNTVLEVLQNIMISKIDIKTLPIYDVEHLLLHSRIVSVGNISKIRINCTCGKKIPVELDLSKAYIHAPKGHQDTNISLGQEEGSGKEIVLHMKYPAFDGVTFMKKNSQKNILRVCIDSISTGDENFSFDEATDEELDEWLTSLPKDRLLKVFDFVNNMPKMAIDIKETCDCGNEVEMRIDDFETFFT